MGNVALTIRGHLIGDAGIIAEVSTSNIFIHNSPKPKATKQIVIKDIPGPSNSVLDLEQGEIQLMIIVDETISGPYAKVREITELVLDLLNKKNETLIDSNSKMRWFVKTGADYIYSQAEYYWMGLITFGYVEGGITD